MAYPFSIAPLLRAHGLVGYFNWRALSPTPAARQQFKDQLIEHVPHWLDRYKQQYASLTHSPRLMACWTQINSQRVGLDIELTNRIQPSLIYRIEQLPQWQQIPLPALKLIWSLKEASFKSFRHVEKAPATISQIEIQSLTLIHPNVWCFKTQFANQKIVGLAGYWQDHTLAICRHQ